MTTRKHVVVTTEHRGVFAGRVIVRDDAAKTISLADGQMCVYWSADVKGVLGLAATGPSKGCRVSAPVPRLDLQAVTAVMETTPEAAKAWQDRPWK